MQRRPQSNPVGDHRLSDFFRMAAANAGALPTRRSGLMMGRLHVGYCASDISGGPCLNAGRGHSKGPDAMANGLSQPPRFLLLAAGVGARLRPLTHRTPKALVEVGGAPLLDRWFRCIESFCDRPTEVLVNSHHLHEQIAERVAAYARCSRSRWAVAHEPSLLGTAATLRKHAEWLNGTTPSMVIYADNYSSIDLRRFWAAHIAWGEAATMALFRTETPHACGIVVLNDQNRVVDFQEKPKAPAGNLASAGLLAFQAGVLKPLLREEDQDLGRDLLPRLPAAGWLIDGFHYDIGTHRNLALVRRKVRNGELK